MWCASTQMRQQPPKNGQPAFEAANLMLFLLAFGDTVPKRYFLLIQLRRAHFSKCCQNSLGGPLRRAVFSSMLSYEGVSTVILIAVPCSKVHHCASFHIVPNALYPLGVLHASVLQNCFKMLCFFFSFLEGRLH